MGPRGRNNRNGGKTNRTVEKRVALLGKKIGLPRKKWDCGNKKMGLLEKANKDLNKVSYDWIIRSGFFSNYATMTGNT